MNCSYNPKHYSVESHLDSYTPFVVRDNMTDVIKALEE